LRSAGLRLTFNFRYDEVGKMNMQGKSAIVTGSTKGIGRAIAEALLEHERLEYEQVARIAAAARGST